MQHQKRANLPLSLQTTPLTIGTRKVKSESEVDWDMSAKISINRAPDGWRQAYGRHTISELTGRLPHRTWKYVKVPMPMTFQAWIPDPYQWPLFYYHATLSLQYHFHCSKHHHGYRLSVMSPVLAFCHTMNHADLSRDHNALVGVMIGSSDRFLLATPCNPGPPQHFPTPLAAIVYFPVSWTNSRTKVRSRIRRHPIS